MRSMSPKTELYKSNSFSNIKNQGGWTFWSLSFTLGVLAFSAYVGMQLVPVYSSNSNVVKAMEQSAEKNDLRKVSRRDIINSMDRQLYLDGTHELLDYKTDLKITRSRSKFIIAVTYERRVPLFANVNLTVDFKPKVECSLVGSCETTKW